LSQWQRLLDRAADGLDRLRKADQPVPPWLLGGGTALMLHAGHRLSKDIDIFIQDPQYLPFLSPRLGGEDVWNCDTFEEAAQHLKLIFPEGEIDFIVAPPITNLSSEKKSVDMSEIGRPGPLVVDVEYPVEIALKKLVYRGRMLKVRDIFDIAVVDHYFSKLLHSNLVHVKDSQAGILARLKGISETFLRLELNELDISESWRREADTCLARVTAIMSGHA
jgi:Nucleotidyl transferase AbiEii toxin, Type IV TA system